jgi:hypothetical protein
VTFIKKQRQGKTIGIVGSRRRDSRADHRACVKAFNKLYKPGDRIVSGGCPKGGDRFAELIAKRRGLTITIHYPDWDGPAKKGAGFVRNTKIAEECDILIALPADDRTGGTEDTIRKAAKLKKKIVLVLERT